LALATVARQVEIPLPMLHTGQRQVLQDVRRFNWLAAGRRWRKTTLCMRIAVEAASRRQAILWGAPTYDQVRVGWEEAKRAAGQWATFNESRMEARFPGGGRIFYRSLDNPDNARGHTADGVVIDEAASVSPAAWYEVIRPMLIDTNGWAWIIGTPVGRNWFWQEWMRARDGEIPDSAAWQAPSLGVDIVDGRLIRSPHPLENSELPYSEVQQLFDTMPERAFRQEILAEFVEDGGGVFRNVRAVSTLPRGDYDPRHFYVAGADWGRTNDYTVISIWDATTKEQVAMERFTGIDSLTQLNRVETLYNAWQWDILLAESNSIGRANIEHLQRQNIPVRGFEMSHGSKLKLIDSYALGFERQAFKLLNDDTQILEHEAFEQETLSGGLIRFKSPSGIHDDTVIAGALAWSQAKHAGEGFKPEYDLFSDDRTVNDLPGMKKFFHTEEKKGKW
jgi:hypothetical protein